MMLGMGLGFIFWTLLVPFIERDTWDWMKYKIKSYSKNKKKFLVKNP